MSIKDLTSQLTLDDYGVYRSRTAGTISYPADGHKNCFLLEDSSFWFRHRNSCITSMVRQFPPSGPIVDIGGGNGYVTRGMLDAGIDSILLEPGAEGAMNGKLVRKIPIVICSTFADAGFKQASLSAVGCFDVIEHIENDREFIKQIHFTLKPGGLIYIAVPACQWLWSQNDVVAQHYRRYNKAMIEQVLSGRFEILYSTYFFSVLTIPIFVFRSLPFHLGLSRDRSLLSAKSEHGIKKGMGGRLFTWILRRELSKINRNHSISFGASCLFVARKLDPVNSN